MLALIPLPYRILGILLLVLALLSGGFGYGVKVTKDHIAAQQLAAERLATLKYQAEVTRGNTLSAKLATAESNIQIKTIERIKYVPQVTTGRDCLSPAAVGLLNGTGYPKSSSTTGQPAPESGSAPAATDTDVEAWAIDASGRYDVCAERLNLLIDFEVGRP